MGSNWIYGGSGYLFRDLTWENRPDMSANAQRATPFFKV
jgi:hypothetical protein